MIRFISNTIIKILSKADKKYQANFYFNIENSYWQTIYDDYKTKYSIDDSFKFNGKRILFYGKGKIICGKNSYIGEGSTIQSELGSEVKIGYNCAISHNVRIYSSSNIANQDFKLNSLKEKKIAKVVIGNGVWIGANVFINQGISIGDNVVVGANSVVTKNLLENGIYGGVPAKLLKTKTI